MLTEPKQINSTFNPEQFNAEFETFTSEIPGVISATSPDQASKQEQMRAFLADEIDNPDCVYPRLDALTADEIASHQSSAQSLLDQASLLGEPHRSVHEAFINQNLLQANLVLAMKLYNEAVSAEDKNIARERFMHFNIELYGEPDRITYLSLLSEKIANIADKQRSPEAEKVFNELRDLLPDEAFRSELASARFRPSTETVAWMHDAVISLYGDLLRHAPDMDELISPEQLRSIFEVIIHEEFGEAADGWKAVLKDAKAISVGAKSKTITVPVNREPMSVGEVRCLIAHEVGIHMLTALTGESTDIAPLGRGLAGYYDTQEGLGKVAEQALEGEFKEAGVDHYITAGLAYFDNKDFRSAFEVKWRMKLLEDLESGTVPAGEQIVKARKLAADGPLIATTRVFRGTDELPLFKDLSYYNGSVQVWKYLEEICGDDLQLSLLLAGKISTSKEDQRVVLESRST